MSAVTFRKELSISKRHALGGKDAKAFKQKLSELYPGLKDNGVDLVFPPKTTITRVQLGSRATLYLNDLGNPMFFDPNGHGDRYYPTIYTLSLMPALIPTLSCPPAVSKKILQGADLFLQGVLDEPVPPFLANSMMAVSVTGNAIPFAIGTMAISFTQAKANGMKGKGVNIMHCFGDALWKLGNQGRPNDGFLDDCVVPWEVESSGSSAEDTENTLQSRQEGMNQTDIHEFPNQSNMDDLVRNIAIGSLRGIKSSELPIVVADFFTKFMQPFKPDDLTIDFKKTRYKKLTKLLVELEEEGLIKMKTFRKENSIFRIEREHEALVHWKPLPRVSEKKEETDFKHVRRMKILNLWKPPSSLRPVFGSSDALYTFEDIQYLLEKYCLAACQNKELNGTLLVVPDGILLGSLWGKKEAPREGEMVKFQDMVQRVLSRFQRWHEVTRVLPDGGTVKALNKGELQPIQVVVHRKNGRNLTSIRGAENFGFSAQNLADVLQKRMKTACYVSDIPGKNAKGQEIDMGGDWITKKTGTFNLLVYFEEQGIGSDVIHVANKLKK